MNILNYAIDKESLKVVQWIAEQVKDDKNLRNSLLEYRYNEHGV